MDDLCVQSVLEIKNSNFLDLDDWVWLKLSTQKIKFEIPALNKKKTEMSQPFFMINAICLYYFLNKLHNLMSLI